MVSRNTLEMRNIGPGTYSLPSTFNMTKGKETVASTIGGTSMNVPKYTQKMQQQLTKQDRFSQLNASLDRQKLLPGPGQYQISTTPDDTKEGDASLNKDQQIVHKHTVGAGNLGRIKKGVYPSFGTNQVRELKLINEEETKDVPGPGRYDLEPFNIDDLLRQCEDKKIVKEILSNLQERLPTSTFVSKGPRIAVF